MIKGDVRLFLAAKSIQEFLKVKAKLPKRVECVYWPILSVEEGYWISPFSSHTALERVLGSLEGSRIPVMLDLELPTTKNPWLYLKEFFRFFGNKQMIKKFIEEHRNEVYLCEYYPKGRFREWVLRFLGVHYDVKGVKVIKMYYHSLHDFDEEFFRCEMAKGVSEWKENYLAAFGTIARGINGDEPILPVGNLERDLEIARKCGVSEVVIFRLGGLDKEYAKMFTRFMK